MEMKIAYKKLEIIYKECAEEYQTKRDKQANLDDFGRLRKELHQEVKKARIVQN